MNDWLDLVSWVCLLAGSFFAISGGIGIDSWQSASANVRAMAGETVLPVWSATIPEGDFDEGSMMQMWRSGKRMTLAATPGLCVTLLWI